VKNIGVGEFAHFMKHNDMLDFLYSLPRLSIIAFRTSSLEGRLMGRSARAAIEINF